MPRSRRLKDADARAIARAIRRMMDQEGISQAELARRARMSKGYLSTLLSALERKPSRRGREPAGPLKNPTLAVILDILRGFRIELTDAVVAVHDHQRLLPPRVESLREELADLSDEEIKVFLEGGRQALAHYRRGKSPE